MMTNGLKRFKQRILLLMCTQLLLVSMASLLIVYLVMFPGVELLEKRHIEANLDRIEARLDKEIDHLEKIAYDWASRDDSYNFVDKFNEAYLMSNISEDTLMSFSGNLIVYMSDEDEIIYGAQVNVIDQTWLPLTDDHSEWIVLNVTRARFESNEPFSGIAETANGPLIIVGEEIRKTDGSGEGMGYLLLGQAIDEGLVEAMRKDLQLEFTLETYTGEMNVSLDGSSVMTEVLNRHQIKGVKILDPFDQGPTLMITMKMPRELVAISQKGINRIILSVIGLSLISTLLMYRMINKRIVRKLQLNETEIEDSKEALMVLNETLERTVDERTKALSESNLRFESILQALPDVVFRLNKDGYFIDSEGGDQSRLLVGTSEFIGKHISEIMPEPIANVSMSLIQSTLNSQEMTVQEYALTENDVTKYYEVRFTAGSKEDVYAILRDLTDIKLKQQHIEYLSYHDQLTEVYNRRFFEEALERLDSERRLPLSIAMLDVNGLKLINDVFGHAKGDELLVEIAKILSRNIRDGDILARIGGDEFIIVLPNTHLEEAERIAGRIRVDADAEKFSDMVLSISIGLATKTEIVQRIQEVIDNAEDKMYSKKLVESQIMREKTCEQIILTLENYSTYEGTHQYKVMDSAVRIGRRLGIVGEELLALRDAGRMHDIGKIGIDQGLIIKERSLSHEEYSFIKKHSEKGYQILKSIDRYSSIAEVVLYHHERWDGQGYPRGLKGNEIPLMSRIITVADAYEAMTNKQPYREAGSKDEAIKELRKYSGTQFDPMVVEAYIKELLL